MKLGTLAKTLGLTLEPADAADLEIVSPGPIETASPDQLIFAASPRYASQLAKSRAGACICSPALAGNCPVPRLLSETPEVDFARASHLFYTPARPSAERHPSAQIHPSAILGDGVRIGPLAVIGREVVVADGVEIHARVVLYEGVRVGAGTVIHAGCVLREHTVVGERCLLQPNVVLGGDGFGFARHPDGHYEKIAQMGTVRIGDDVEIGAGTTVDRATFGATTVGSGCKIDNLVQIGHNCQIGEHSILCAQVGLAGSTTVGRNVTLAGQVGVAGHLTIGDGVIATAQTGIPSSVPPGQIVSGYPAIENRAWLKSAAIFTRLPDLHRLTRRLEAKLTELEKRFIG